MADGSDVTVLPGLALGVGVSATRFPPPQAVATSTSAEMVDAVIAADELINLSIDLDSLNLWPS